MSTRYEIGPRGESRPVADATDPLIPEPATGEQAASDPDRFRRPEPARTLEPAGRA